MKSFEKRKLKYKKLNKPKKVIVRDYDQKERIEYNKKLCIKYGLSPSERRKAYTRWQLAMKRGHKFEFEEFLKNKRVQVIKGKPKKYYVAKRFMQVARAMPKWVNIDEIAEFYMNCPDGYHVDHIIPINGDNVSGLHVIWNLQYLPAKQNRKKSNKI